MSIRFEAIRRSALYAVLAAVGLTTVPSAKADTYHFMFTTNNLLEALKADDAQQDPQYQLFEFNGYFTIFMQPLDLSGYAYEAMFSPKPAGPGVNDAWEANVVTGPAEYLGSGDW